VALCVKNPLCSALKSLYFTYSEFIRSQYVGRDRKTVLDAVLSESVRFCRRSKWSMNFYLFIFSTSRKITQSAFEVSGASWRFSGKHSIRAALLFCAVVCSIKCNWERVQTVFKMAQYFRWMKSNKKEEIPFVKPRSHSLDARGVDASDIRRLALVNVRLFSNWI
jgi:hypothetical protein